MKTMENYYRHETSFNHENQQHFPERRRNWENHTYSNPSESQEQYSDERYSHRDDYFHHVQYNYREDGQRRYYDR